MRPREVGQGSDNMQVSQSGPGRASNRAVWFQVNGTEIAQTLVFLVHQVVQHVNGTKIDLLVKILKTGKYEAAAELIVCTVKASKKLVSTSSLELSPPRIREQKESPSQIQSLCPIILRIPDIRRYLKSLRTFSRGILVGLLFVLLITKAHTFAPR